MPPEPQQKLAWYQRHLDRPLTLDDCPDPGCERRMTLVLEVNGGPDAPGGGSFLYCEPCGELWVRAGTA